MDELEHYLTNLLGAVAFPAAFRAYEGSPAFHRDHKIALSKSDPGRVRIVLKCAHDPLPDQPARRTPHLVSDCNFFGHVVKVLFAHVRQVSETAKGKKSKKQLQDEVQAQVLQHWRNVFAKPGAADSLPAVWPPVPNCVENCGLYQNPETGGVGAECLSGLGVGMWSGLGYAGCMWVWVTWRT